MRYVEKVTKAEVGKYYGEDIKGKGLGAINVKRKPKKQKVKGSGELDPKEKVEKKQTSPQVKHYKISPLSL